MTLSWTAARQQRASLALAAAAGDPVSAGALLRGWSWSDRPEVVGRLVADLDPADTPLTRRLATWAIAPDRGLAPSEAERDRTLLAAAEPGPPFDRAGALTWLARLGEEVRRREDRAWRERRFAPDSRDAEVEALWHELLRGDFGPDAPRRFATLYADAVRRAYRGVCGALGLPRAVVEQRVAEALEASDGLAWGAPGDLAARVLETTGEPLAALAPVLDGAAAERVQGCIDRRRLWHRLQPLLGPGTTPDLLPVGADLVVASRLIAALNAGTIREHTLGLPGWHVVQANRGRLRGRLRAVLAEHPALLAEALGSLDALHARTDDAVRRHAWAWAWREARTGFGFDPARLRAPACPPPPPEGPPLEPLGPDQEAAVLTWLLAMRGRGQWPALEGWLAGARGRSLGATFYRHLGDAPDVLADPGTAARSNRGYERLREHLQDGGLDAYLPRLQQVARRVAVLSPGRGLLARLAEALQPDWDPALIPLPRRGADALCAHLATLAG